MHLLEKAIVLATEAHAGQKDKAGLPYILHPIAVMQSLYTMDEKIVGVLHDVIEDTHITSAELVHAGFSPEVVSAAVAISKQDGEAYEDYLKRVKADPLALSVKLADIAHNMSRLDNLAPKHAGYLAAKYTRALKFLRSE
jgi:(p)ppGpp synthase/HD superfamily hydrolase